MKVFWKTVSEPVDQAHRPFSAQNLAIEEVYFPEYVVEEIRGALERSKMLLPAKAREFQGWRVGLLRRFEGREVVCDR